jgi:hypothetical protein
MALKKRPKETTHYKYMMIMMIFVLGDMKRRALYCTSKSLHILQNLDISSTFVVNPEERVSIYLQNISSTAPCPQTASSLKQN